MSLSPYLFYQSRPLFIQTECRLLSESELPFYLTVQVAALSNKPYVWVGEVFFYLQLDYLRPPLVRTHRIPASKVLGKLPRISPREILQIIKARYEDTSVQSKPCNLIQINRIKSGEFCISCIVLTGSCLQNKHREVCWQRCRWGQYADLASPRTLMSLVLSTSQIYTWSDPSPAHTFSREENYKYLFHAK